METNFIVKGIVDTEFKNLFDMDDDELSTIGGIRMKVNKKPGYPCRVSLEDAEIGEEVILFPYDHHRTKSPYQAKGPIFIRKNATNANLGINEIPKMLEHRLLSLRTYDQRGIMIDARTLKGTEIKKEITDIFENGKARYIHVHNAGPGCYNCEIKRIY